MALFVFFIEVLLYLIAFGRYETIINYQLQNKNIDVDYTLKKIVIDTLKESIDFKIQKIVRVNNIIHCTEIFIKR